MGKPKEKHVVVYSGDTYSNSTDILMAPAELDLAYEQQRYRKHIDVVRSKKGTWVSLSEWLKQRGCREAKHPDDIFELCEG